MLLMKKVFLDAIRSGAKTTTLRYWRWSNIKAGSIQNLRGIGAVRIDEVRQVELEQLMHSDVRDDGFDDFDALRDALEEIYPPEKRADRRLYQIRFTFLGAESPQTQRTSAKLKAP